MAEFDDQFELQQRYDDQRQTTHAALDRSQSRTWTSMPVQVVAPGYDATNQTVSVQSTIKGRQRQRGDDGKWVWKDVSMPVLAMVPVEFPNGGGLNITHPINVGDEGVVHFQSRAIDNWWAQGGEQPALTPNGVGSLRQHNLSDGIFRSGARSKPKALPNVSQTGIQIRNDAGTAYVEFSSTGFKVVFPGGKQFAIDANGNVTTSGNITAGFGGADLVTLQNHTHAQPVDGHGDAEAETIKPTAGH